MNKLLVICGPTATGKTQLALFLAKIFNGKLISADSRQVYKYMDIGTGKDVKGILGYDLVNPNEEFSISNYSRFARSKIQEIQKENKLPIIVGGSGLYIKSITDNIHTIDILPNKTLRENLKDQSAIGLMKILKTVDSTRLSLMNNSDRNNPRRLIRAIEVATDKEIAIKQNSDYDVLFIGVGTSTNELQKRIGRRVDERVKSGFSNEVAFLKKNNFWNGAPSVTLGYKEWPDTTKWKKEEVKYAKRQMTWFRKDKRIKWFDITHQNFKSEVEKMVQKWYSLHHAKES